MHAGGTSKRTHHPRQSNRHAHKRARAHHAVHSTGASSQRTAVQAQKAPTACRLRPRTCCESPDTLGWRRMNASVFSSSSVGLEPALASTRRARPLGCSISALNRCSVSTICWFTCGRAHTRVKPVPDTPPACAVAAQLFVQSTGLVAFRCAIPEATAWCPQEAGHIQDGWPAEGAAPASRRPAQK